jgi:hypothetical protein
MIRLDNPSTSYFSFELNTPSVLQCLSIKVSNSRRYMTNTPSFIFDVLACSQILEVIKNRPHTLSKAMPPATYSHYFLPRHLL